MCQGGEGKRERVIEVQNDIGAKPLRKNKILDSDGGKLKREKTIDEPSESGRWLETREKGPRDLFMPFYAFGMLMQVVINKLNSLKA